MALETIDIKNAISIVDKKGDKHPSRQVVFGEKTKDNHPAAFSQIIKSSKIINGNYLKLNCANERIVQKLISDLTGNREHEGFNMGLSLAYFYAIDIPDEENPANMLHVKQHQLATPV